ncbi:MAG: hypothetical protein QMD12_00965 [Candidatus Aenigmarchaeota archaeon]|nr:hypothetical protein [Candidatus Aenigmarchaeota archaeon]
MSKAQSLVVQFMLFFMTGFSVFLAISGLFKYQSDMFRDNLLSYDVELANSYLSSAAIALVDSCKQCDSSKVYLKFPSSTLGYYYGFKLENGLNVSVISREEKNYASSIHNLNYSLVVEGSTDSTRRISLTFEKTKNKLVVE